MILLERIRASGSRSVSVVGLAKNAGKTVAVNTIMRQCETLGMAIGLSSIGYDGEKFDILSRQPKPRLEISAGTIIATADATLHRASASLEILAATGFYTALGEIMIVRARESGHVEVAGPDSLSEMRRAIEHMHRLGCELVVVDGALDRLGSAAPAITDSTVLATGAAIGGGMAKIISRSRHITTLFSLPAVSDPALVSVAASSRASNQIMLVDAMGARPLAVNSLLGHAAEVINALPKNAFTLVIPGALTDSLLGEISRHPALAAQATLIVPDATHLFLTPALYQKFCRLRGRILVVKPIRIVAVTVNPHAPSAVSFAPRQFARDLARAVAPLPVYDLFLGETAVPPEEGSDV